MNSAIVFRAASRVPVLGGMVRWAHDFRAGVLLIKDPVDSRTYYPEEPRKGRPRMIADAAWGAFRYKEFNKHYFRYGLDRQHARLDDVLPYWEFRRIRDSRNCAANGEGYNYVCLLRDKFVFGQLATSLDFPTPKNLAFLHSNHVEWIRTRRTAPLESLADVEIDGFCKPFAGIQGDGVFPLRIGDSISVDGRHTTIADLRSRLTSRYLLQERLVQHPEVSALHPNSMNTVRLITVNDRSEVKPFSVSMRIGTEGRFVDNWAAGGIVVSVDLERARLRGRGMYKFGRGTAVMRHPDTGIAFDGYPIPRLGEAVDLACRFHRDLRYIHTIGWDIALTPEGPSFIEGNDNWEGGIPMALEPDFKKRFLALYK